MRWRTSLARGTPGHVVVVAGPPGSGRSTALATITLEARRRGITVLTIGAVGHPPPGRGLVLRRGHDPLEIQVAQP